MKESYYFICYEIDHIAFNAPPKHLVNHVINMHPLDYINSLSNKAKMVTYLSGRGEGELIESEEECFVIYRIIFWHKISRALYEKYYKTYR